MTIFGTKYINIKMNISKRKYKFKRVPNEMKLELKILSEKLPSGLGLTQSKHLERLFSIYTKKYMAIDRKDRDTQLQEELKAYCRAIYDIVDADVQLDGDYKPTIVENFESKDRCIVCTGDDITKFSADESEKRYICNKCQAVHIPANGKTEIFTVTKTTDAAANNQN